MKYIGDISDRDANILAFLASRYSRILEFGCGGSTQVMAQSLSDGAHLVSLDTDQAWLDRTKRNLDILGVDAAKYTLDHYSGWLDRHEGPFDLVFVDGVDDQRGVFGRAAWHKLAVGGTIVFHDTRRVRDMRTCMELAMEHFNEIGDIFMNMDGSNLSGFQRKPLEPYRDWNVEEGNAPWMSGAAEPPDNWPELIEG